MLTLIRRLRFYVRNVAHSILDRRLQLDKYQASSPVKESLPLYQSQYSPAINVDTSIQTSCQNKEKNWTNNYSGLQDEIYNDVEVN